jgi:hypothetical protein
MLDFTEGFVRRQKSNSVDIILDLEIGVVSLDSSIKSCGNGQEGTERK